MAVRIVHTATKKLEDLNMKAQKHLCSGLLAVVGLIVVMSGCATGKEEVSVKFSDCPAAVQKTITEYAGGVQFPEVDKETKKDGRVVYEAKGKRADGKKMEIKVAPDGHLVGLENGDDN